MRNFGARHRRRRNWIVVGLIAIGIPISPTSL
jgi:hypothetical protein